ncbi:autotransporter outer membrane beta-barrel domain-containing protein [Bartonella sp. B17]
MINVFRNHAHLCAITTSVFFFLQGVDVYAVNDAAAEGSMLLWPLENAKKVKSEDCIFKSYAVNQGPISCKDGKSHTMTGGAIVVTRYGDDAVQVVGKSRGASGLANGEAGRLAKGDVDAVGKTAVKIRRTSIRGINSTEERSNGLLNQGSQGLGSGSQGLGSAVFATANAKVDLEESNIQSFIVGLDAQKGTQTSMKNGKISKSHIGAVSTSGASIDLSGVNIDVYKTGVLSVGSVVNMQSGSIVVKESGAAVISEGGAVKLKSVKISVNEEGKAKSTDSTRVSNSNNEVNYGFRLYDSFLSIDKGSFDSNNAVILSVSGSPFIVDSVSGEDVYSGYVTTAFKRINQEDKNGADKRNDAKKVQGSDNSDLDVFGDVVSVINRVNANNMRMGSWKISASMSHTNITSSGKDSYGVFFTNKTKAVKSKQKDTVDATIKTGARVVFFDNVNLTVSDGIGIYGEGLNGHIVVKGKSRIASSLLLGAGPSSELSIFSSGATLMGGARIDKSGDAKLFLGENTNWSLVKSKHKNWKFSNENCVDSCISSINFSNSSVKFFPPKNKEDGYQTLLIGKGNGTVYTAGNEAALYLSAGIIAGVSSSDQMSDRVLIHGDVSGKTKLYVNNSVNRKGNSNLDSAEENKDALYSVSVIQVYGDAKKDSFELQGGYVTLKGSPYQYVLRAYGPTVTSGVRYLNDESVSKSKMWDFRLEGKTESRYGGGINYGAEYVTEEDMSVYLLNPSDGRLGLEDNGYQVVSYVDAADTASEESTVQDSRPVGRVLLNAALGRSEGDATEDVVVAPPSSVPSSTSAKPTTTAASAKPATATSAKPTTAKPARAATAGLARAASNTSIKVVSNIPVKVTSAKVGRSEVTPSTSSLPVVPAATDVAVSKETTKPVARVLSTTSVSAEPTVKSAVSVSPKSTVESAASVFSAASVSSMPVVGSASRPSKSSAVFACSVNENDAKGTSSQSYFWCQNGTSNEIKGRTLNMTDSNMHAVYAKGGNQETVAKIGQQRSDNGKSQVLGHKTIINVEDVTITGVGFSKENNVSSKENNVNLTNIKPDNFVSAVLAKENAEVIVKGNKTSIKSFPIGLEAQAGGSVNMTDGKIDALYVGAMVGPKSSVKLNNTKINVQGSLATAGLSANGGAVVMDSGQIEFEKGVGVLSELGGDVKLTKVRIVGRRNSEDTDSKTTLGREAFLLRSGSSIDFERGSVLVEGNHGLRFKDVNGSAKASSKANITSSIITVHSNNDKNKDKFYGIYFDGSEAKPRESRVKLVNAVKENTNAQTGNAIQELRGEVSVSADQNINSNEISQVSNGSSPVLNNEVSRTLSNGVSRVRRAVEKSITSPKDQNLTDKSVIVSLRNTKFRVFDGVAVYGYNSEGTVFLETKSVLSGDFLLKSENNSNLSIVANDSVVIKGAVRVDNSSRAKIALLKGSQWFLDGGNSTGRQDAERVDCLDTCISAVTLGDAAGIRFFSFVGTENPYRTLRIGKGNGVVYSASKDSWLDINVDLDPENYSNDKQVGDRILIHGDVSGKTDVNVGHYPAKKNRGLEDELPYSVSIIQVYGKAEKDSFRLPDGGYVTIKGLPYKYTLRSYGPDDAREDVVYFDKTLVEDGKEFWDFRLENQYVNGTDSTSPSGASSSSASSSSASSSSASSSSASSSSASSGRVSSSKVSSSGASSGRIPSAGIVPSKQRPVIAVVPQVPTYLLLPNSLFHAGLMDISNQSKQLESLRAISDSSLLETHENPALFLRGYGSSYSYASNLSALEYGYGSELDYNAVEAGVLLKKIESSQSDISLGIMGSYGKLSLQPLKVEQSEKSTFDKWSVTAYGTMHHDLGFYVDGLLSYGLFKGDVLTLARGKTATLESNPLSVSLIGGQSFTTGYEGLVLDPQVQVVYQYLQFKEVRDVDNVDIKMKNLDQWVVRVGGRLIKSTVGSEDARAVSFYGKLHLVHDFGKKQTVHFKDAFQLGAFGSSLEAGLGFNVKLFTNFALHGDVVYQHRLNKVGFSGASFSGGLRYQF